MVKFVQDDDKMQIGLVGVLEFRYPLGGFGS